MKNLREEITAFIERFAAEEDSRQLWRQPLVKFGDASAAEMQTLSARVHPHHAQPSAVLPQAKTVICYFFPFREEIGESNRTGAFSSSVWAEAYETTNAAFRRLNDRLIAFLGERGIAAAVSPDAFAYDEELCQSRWSQKSFACLSGMGRFGLHHLLITDRGCCGRLGTVLMDAEVPYDAPAEEEYCLYLRDGSCTACVRACPVGALTADAYDVHRCHDRCMENETLYPGDAICGKCAVGLPCSYQKP